MASVPRDEDGLMQDAMPLTAPAFKKFWECEDMRGAVVVYETDEDAVRDLLEPSPFEYVASTVWMWVAELRQHDLVPHRESWHYFALFMPGRFEGQVGKFGAFEYADDATAIMAGRELLGESKKWAEFTWEANEDGLQATVNTYGRQIADIQVSRADGPEPAPPVEAFLADKSLRPEVMVDLNVRSLPSPIPGEKPVRHIVVNPLATEGARFPARMDSLSFPSVRADPPWVFDDRLDRFPVRRELSTMLLRGRYVNGCRDADGLRMVEWPA